MAALLVTCCSAFRRRDRWGGGEKKGRERRVGREGEGRREVRKRKEEGER